MFTWRVSARLRAGEDGAVSVPAGYENDRDFVERDDILIDVS